MINVGVEIFTNPQKPGAALTRPRKVGVTGEKTTNTTANGKRFDWGKTTI